MKQSQDTKSIFRIAIEECIRCMALEVVVGLPPIGIAQGLGVSDLSLVAVISLPVPILVSVFKFAQRVKGLGRGAEAKARPWRMARSQWVALLIGAVLALAYGFWLHGKGTMSNHAMTQVIMLTAGWVVLGLLFTVVQRK